MKRALFLVGILAALLLAADSGHAFILDGPQILDDWTQRVVSGNFTSTTGGSQMELDVSGDEGEAVGIRYKEFTNAIGIMARFNVSSFSGYMVVGLGRYLGTTASGNLIQAQIYLDTWSGYNRIYYRVREQTPDLQTTVRTLASGFLGDHSGGLWEIGENVILAFARLGNDIYFYTPGNGAYVIIRPFENMGAISDSDYPPSIFGHAPAGEENYATVVVSGVNIVYP